MAATGHLHWWKCSLCARLIGHVNYFSQLCRHIVRSSSRNVQFFFITQTRNYEFNHFSRNEPHMVWTLHAITAWQTAFLMVKNLTVGQSVCTVLSVGNGHSDCLLRFKLRRRTEDGVTIFNFNEQNGLSGLNPCTHQRLPGKQIKTTVS